MPPANPDPARVAVLFRETPVTGRVDIANGRLAGLDAGNTHFPGPEFGLAASGPARILVEAADARLAPGAEPTLVTVTSDRAAFSFFLRDVTTTSPILVPEYGVAVVPADDSRDYAAVEADIRSRGLRTQLRQIEAEPEETFDQAAGRTLKMHVPTLLGISRDCRVFLVGYRGGPEMFDWIVPWFHNRRVNAPGDGGTLRYTYQVGRGIGCCNEVSRRLDNGVLPILRTTIDDGDVRYHLTTFVTLDSGPLGPDRIEGSDALLGGGDVPTPEMAALVEQAFGAERARERQTVLCARVEAENTADVPRYAWFKAPVPESDRRIDPETGFAHLPSDHVYCALRLDGEPVPQEEMSVLVPERGRLVYEFLIPHSPVTPERAARLAALDLDVHLEACRAFWRGKLAAAAKMRVPERRIDEMIRAGLLHLDLHTYGREPDGTLAAEIGLPYSPIGTESAPIIQFFDSVGCHDLAARALQFFLDRQRDDGFIQIFGGYMVETGAVLWSMGEHYRYTRDRAWLYSVLSRVLKACDYLAGRRKANSTGSRNEPGFGLIDGKCADPEDRYRSFMLNGYAYLGMARTAEMLRETGHDRADALAAEALEWRNDIRRALADAIAASPLIPLGDGTWCPSCPPWPDGARGPLALHTNDAPCWTHGGIACRDSLLGPLYLVFQEVLDPTEREAAILLQQHQELFTLRNVAYSQPYYSRHAWAHLARGEIKAFLKTYYNTMASLADRETYTFWEHHMFCAPHKTHEEGWFLMQTRWMLYREVGNSLRLFGGIPRAWLRDGGRIELENVATYFGPLRCIVVSEAGRGRITATIACPGARRPREIAVRLPHPDGLHASDVRGGDYAPEEEAVKIADFDGHADIELGFPS